VAASAAAKKRLDHAAAVDDLKRCRLQRGAARLVVWREPPRNRR
jgi:hypothetical protein